MTKRDASVTKRDEQVATDRRTYVPTYLPTDRHAPQDARGASTGSPRFAKSLVTAWVDACRAIGRTERTDSRSLGILGRRCSLMLKAGYEYDDLLRVIRANVDNRATNPACIATWIFRMSEREDPTGAKAWTRVLEQARAAGIDLSLPKLRRAA